MSEIQDTLAELKARIAELENKLAELEQVPETEPVPEPEEDMSPIDISIEMDSLDEPVVPAAEAVAKVPEEKPVESVPKPVEKSVEPAPEAAEKPNINDLQERNVKKAVMDVMGQKQAWKTAIPGTPVKNVISAISLNDRVLFINTLFKEDPIAFQDAIAAFNSMSSFAEAEAYVHENHPDWDLDSDLVFRLMMAVRRKLK